MNVTITAAADVAKLVKRARHQSNLTQCALAERAGVRRHTITQIETGARRPSLSTLVGLLAAAGLQMHVDLEPLDADVRREIEERRAVAEPAADIVGAWGGFAALNEMDRVTYRVEGLAAAALLGAPVTAPTIHIALADTEVTFRWLAGRLRSRLLRVRVDGRWGALDFPLLDRRATTAPDGAAVEAAVEAVRARLAEECPDGCFRLDNGLDELAARLAPADEVARRVVVATKEGPIAVQPLDEVESADPDVARVLRVMRAEARRA